ncbi:MAG: AMIN domain-containing protein [Alphaproteobacteria bacterium]|nr:AMIN domain-containing protein [Alphaproteobacteria bacterium]
MRASGKIFGKTSYHTIIMLALATSSLGACSMEGWTPRGGETAKAGSSEQLLEAEGSWAMVEENSGSDPTKLHSQAKTEVNPADLKSKQFLPEQDMKLATNEKAAHGEDINYRLIRVERDVQSLRDDFHKLLPPLSNLIVADKSLDKTIADIEAKNAIEPASGGMDTTAPAMMAAPPAQKQQRSAAYGLRNNGTSASAPAAPKAPLPTLASATASPAGHAVQNIRLGEYPGKTRLVLDLSGPSSYKTELDNGEKLLLVQIPQAGWGAEQRKSLAGHPLVAGYTAQPAANGGTTLAIELKKPVKISANSALPPNATYKNHRIFIDLNAL